MDLQKQVNLLRRDLAELTEEVYRGNFTSQQDFNKYANFTSRVKLPVVTSLPTSCERGEVIVCLNSGVYKLYVATASNTWAIVGSQS